MRKIAMIILMVVMAAIISGCTVNAEANTEVTYPTLNKTNEEDDEPYRFEIEELVEELEAPTEEIRESNSVVSGGASWIYAKTQEGKRGVKTSRYELLYNRSGDLLSRIEIPGAGEVEETQPILYESGQRAQPGAFFNSSRLTRYGVDCFGCNISSEGKGGTAAGIGVGLNSVRQKNGTWRPGITYEGYYIIAASASIPMHSIVEISNHSLSGMGIKRGVPFKAMVLDRGGAIKGSKIDLFVGGESNMLVSEGGNQSPKIRIISTN